MLTDEELRDRAAARIMGCAFKTDFATRGIEEMEHIMQVNKTWTFLDLAEAIANKCDRLYELKVERDAICADLSVLEEQLTDLANKAKDAVGG